MDDREFELERKRTERSIRRAQNILWLREWRIDIVFRRATSEMDLTGGAEIPHGSEIAAVTSSDWRYRHAAIQVNCESTSEFDQDRLNEIMLHELLHCVVHEMRPGNIDWSGEPLAHEERVVTWLASVVHAATRKAEKPMKKRKTRR